VQPGGDQPGEVGHVDHQVRTDLVGDPPELGEVQLPRVRRPAGDDQLRTALVRQPLDLGHVHPVVVGPHVVGGDVVELAREVEPHPVRQVAAVGQVEAEDGVPRLQQGGHRRGVGLRARVRLHVGVLGTEEPGQPVDGQLLDDVDVLAAAVVAPARVALGVLVRQDRALGLHDGDRREVLAGDHLQRRLLPVQLGGDGPVHRRIGVSQGPIEHAVGGGVATHGWIDQDDHAAPPVRKVDEDWYISHTER
jgi:hypothetical protein